MKKTSFRKKGLVVSIIILFIGVGIYPAIAIFPDKSSDIFLDKNIKQGKNTEPKEYLFQTIIDIANNPEVKDLFEQTKNNGECISWDCDFKSVFQKLLFRKPILIISLIFSIPSITHSYLNNNFNRGCEITKILGEEKVSNIVESTEITNPEFFIELNDIITNDEELSNRISILSEMNEELKPDAPFQNDSSICVLLFILWFVYIIRTGISKIIGNFFEGSILSKLFDLLWYKNWRIAGIIALVFDLMDCDHII